jgi:hypothetical protein
MTADSYYVCTVCGHFWASPFPPDDRRCENCARVHVTTSVRTVDEAMDASERILAYREASA